MSQRVCPELAKTAHNLVMGDGNPDAAVLFIGEAPGKNEDEQGLPFVGAAGRFLDEMLAGIGLNRSDIYITNIVKYRPPGNRDPLPEEKQAFWPYLARQIAIIRPKVIVTLGRHSMEFFLPGKFISKCHGQAKRIHVQYPQLSNYLDTAQNSDNFDQPSSDKSRKGVSKATGKESIIILPLYHPAAALYNGSMRQTLIDDFSKITILLES